MDCRALQGPAKNADCCQCYFSRLATAKSERYLNLYAGFAGNLDLYAGLTGNLPVPTGI
jgi:hypothetical protein